MKFFAVAALAVAAVGVNAQIDPATVPPCILNCVGQAASTIGCSGATDLACLCGASNFVSTVTPCIATNCPNDIPAALQMQQTMCNGVETGAGASGASSSVESAAASSTDGAAASVSSDVASASASVSEAVASASQSVSGAVASASASVSGAAASASSVSGSHAASSASHSASSAVASASASAKPSSAGRNTVAGGALVAAGLLAAALI